MFGEPSEFSFSVIVRCERLFSDFSALWQRETHSANECQREEASDPRFVVTDKALASPIRNAYLGTNEEDFKTTAPNLFHPHFDNSTNERRDPWKKNPTSVLTWNEPST